MIRKSRARFDYNLDTYKGNKVMYITDQGGPTDLTVTNDIENVIADICAREEIKASDYIILYKDGEGNWDAWDAEYENFIILGENNSLDALSVYLGRKESEREKQANDLYERSSA